MSRKFSKKSRKSIIKAKVGPNSFYLVIFIVFSIIAFAFFDYQSISSAIAFSSNATTTSTATIKNVWETGTVIMNEDVIRYDYQFAIPDLGQFPGTSYSQTYSLDIGDTVSIEYSIANPYQSRIKGMRATEIGIGTTWLLLLPLSVLGLLVFKIFKGISFLRFLERGIVATGYVIDIENTQFFGSKKVKISFEDQEGGKVDTILSTFYPLIKQEQEHSIIYDPKDPSKVLLRTDIPSSIRSKIH